LGVLPNGSLTPSFIEIALAVTKRALLTDDDDGRRVIAIAHQSFIEIALAVTKRALLTDDDDGRRVIAIAHQR
jgi:predicted nucleic acid-binding protein